MAARRASPIQPLARSGVEPVQIGMWRFDAHGVAWRDAGQVTGKLEIPKGAHLVARSAGLGAGNAASVLKDGTLVPIAGGYGRGLNVVVFDEAGGAVLEARCYDTHGDPAAADSFAALVEALPPGRVVAIAVQDDATDMLTERAKRACELLGSTRIRALGYRGSWALIGYKGAAPSSGMEYPNNAGAVSTRMWNPYFIT